MQRIIESKGITATITNGWWNRFCQRHPKLCLKTAVPLAHSRAMATDPNVLNRHFDLLKETLRSNGIFNSLVLYLPLCTKGNRNESDRLSGCTRSKKKGNDVNTKCACIQKHLMSLMERVVLKSPFIQDVLGARRKVCNKLNRCTSIV